MRTVSIESAFSQGVEFLSDHGVNLVAVLDCASLPDKIIQALLAEDIPLRDYSRLVLLGNGGSRFWQALQEHGMDGIDPVDDYSWYLAQTLIRRYLDNPRYLRLFPNAYNAPLQQLGALAGWHHPSPLGIGINPRFGLWFAYRAAFLTALALPLSTLPASRSPCEDCVDQPCISACPVHAVHGVDRYDVARCIGYRLAADSPCRDRCFARLACPVAAEHRYSIDQIRYHYLHSLTTVGAYYGAHYYEIRRK